MAKKSVIDNQIEQAEREVLLAKYKTALVKRQMINELKSGLGSEIKTKGGKFTIIKKSFFERFMISLKKIFTSF